MDFETQDSRLGSQSAAAAQLRDFQLRRCSDIISFTSSSDKEPRIKPRQPETACVSAGEKSNASQKWEINCCRENSSN